MSSLDEIDIVLAAVRAHARLLKLPTLGRECDEIARLALASGQHPLVFLRALLDAEIASRSERATERRLRAARLPARKTLSQFDWRRAHGLERARVEGAVVPGRRAGAHGLRAHSAHRCPRGAEGGSRRAQCSGSRARHPPEPLLAAPAHDHPARSRDGSRDGDRDERRSRRPSRIVPLWAPSIASPRIPRG
jgi:hypothetical protein